MRKRDARLGRFAFGVGDFAWSAWETLRMPVKAVLGLAAGPWC